MTPDPIAAATAAIVAVQALHPTLTVFGFRPRGCETLAAERAEMLTTEAAGQFLAASDFIRAAGTTKTWRASGFMSSYALKHRAERWAGRYIANGMLLAAALHLGVPWQRCPNGSPNAYLGLRRRALKLPPRAGGAP
jgi:hypothetical protein